MNNTNGEKLLLARGEWIKIASVLFLTLGLAAGGPMLVLQYHLADAQRHQTESEKAELFERLMVVERKHWAEQLSYEREIFRLTLERQVDAIASRFKAAEERLDALEE